MFKSLCLLLAQASHHRPTTVALFVVAFVISLLVYRRFSRRAGRGLAAMTLAAGIGLVAFCVQAVSRPGSARTAIVVVDKTAQVEQGRIVATSRWGFVDRWHVDAVQEHVAEARAHLSDPETRARPLVLESYCRTLRGHGWTVHREYQLVDPSRFAEADLEDAARAIALQMAFDVEIDQDNAPARTGMRLSAWQFEDLPSALYATIGTREIPARSGSALFARDGWDLVSHEGRLYTLPSSASPAEREAYQRVREAHALWSRTDGPLESPFAPGADS